MTPRKVFYMSIIALALLVLALGGWLAKGLKAVYGPRRTPALRPRYA